MSDSLYYYVRDKGSAVAHHWDYERDRTDHALCGHPYVAPSWEGKERPRSVCRACQTRLAPHEARWWQAEAERLRTQLEAADAERHELRIQNKHQRTELQRLRSTLKQLKAQLQKAKASPGGGTAKVDRTPRRRRTSAGGGYRQPPRIRVVSGGAPGLGKRR